MDLFYIGMILLPFSILNHAETIPFKFSGTYPLQNGSLIFTNVLFRHGDRTPVLLCPNDANNKHDVWPNEWGQLTNLGIQQLYSLGKWLRRRYDSILSRSYKPSEIYVRSTDTDRTIASALSCLAGLYSPLKNNLWNNDTHWQVIPVHTESAKNDYIMNYENSCEQYKKLHLEDLRSKGIHQFLANYLKYFTDKCGLPIQSYTNFLHMYDGFMVEEMTKKTVPKWMKPIYGSPEFDYIFHYIFISSGASIPKARLSGGPLIKEMLTNMKKKMEGHLKANRTMMMYSGHDTSIATLLASLKMFNFTGPPYPRPGYAAVLLMDLILDKLNQPFVVISYRNDSASEPVVIPIPGCGSMCPLNDMFNLYDNILPNNIITECRV